MVDVLFLCTGNLCRSPSAAGLLVRELSTSGPGGVHVESAGILGSTKAPPERLLAEATAFGLDLSTHVSRKFEPDMSVRFDLLIGMSREHVREVVLASPPSFYKAYTLRELVRRGIEKGPRAPGESLEGWLERMHAGRRHLDLIGDSPSDDIPDPMGGSSEDYRNMLTEVESLIRSLHTLIWRQA